MDSLTISRRAILDLNVIIINPRIKDGIYEKFNRNIFLRLNNAEKLEWVEVESTPELEEKREKAKCLAFGYRTINMYCNMLSRYYDGSLTLTSENFHHYQSFKPEFVKVFSEIENVDLNTAEKQLDFETESISQNVIRANMIKLRAQKKLIDDVKDQQSLLKWQADFFETFFCRGVV
jgi:hypothetical protein